MGTLIAAVPWTRRKYYMLRWFLPLNQPLRCSCWSWEANSRQAWAPASPPELLLPFCCRCAQARAAELIRAGDTWLKHPDPPPENSNSSDRDELWKPGKSKTQSTNLERMSVGTLSRQSRGGRRASTVGAISGLMLPSSKYREAGTDLSAGGSCYLLQ